VTAEDIVFARDGVVVGRVDIGGALLTIEDRTLAPVRTWRVEDLALRANRISSRRDAVQGVATFRATVAGAAVSAWLTHMRLDPLELHATAIARNLDLALVRLYVPPAVPVHLERGVVNASVQVSHAVQDGTRLTGDVTVTGVEARGRGTAGPRVAAPSLRLTLADGRRHGDTSSIGRVELTGAGTVTDARAGGVRYEVERLRVAAEGLAWPVTGPARFELSAGLRDRSELDASGTAQLTAPPPDVAWTSEVTAQVKRLSLALLAAYVPAARGLAGRVSASLTGTVAYGGALTARVRGEARASRLSLTDGGRTLLGARRLQAAGIDVNWPERIDVGQVRIEQPEALVERDPRGAFPLVSAFAPAGPPAAVPSTEPSARRTAIAVGEVAIERGKVTLADALATPAVRLDVPRVDVTLRDVTWPATGAVRVRLDAVLPRRGSEGAEGTVAVEGTVAPESRTIDGRIVLKDARLGLLQPYLPFAARVRGRVDADVAIAGPLSPTPRVSVHGAAAVRRLRVADVERTVVTAEEIDAPAISAAWPERVTLDTLRVRRSWALIERDRQGGFLLRRLFGRRPSTAAPPAPSSSPSSPPGPPPEFLVRDAVFEEGAATVIDGVTTPPARFEIAGARLAVQDLAWPAVGPVKLEVRSPMPGGGTLDARGTLALEPLTLDARVVLDGVQLAPAQPYLPIEGRVQGRVTGDLGVKVALEPLAVQVAGQARLQAFRLNRGDLPVATVGRVDATGIDVDWPQHVAVETVTFRRPRLLVERDADGQFLLHRLVTPRWTAATGDRPGTGAAAPPAGRDPDVGGAPGAVTPPAPALRVGTFGLERASVRFVDQTTAPPYAEELSDVHVTFRDLTTTPGHRFSFTASGAVGGGSSFTAHGEAAAGPQPVVDLKVDLRDFAIPRANPYLDKFTSWTAMRGSMNASATYVLRGTRLDARHDLVVRNLAVARSGEADQVEDRLGLPLGFLIALMKDARGEIRVSVPVSGDVATRAFDFREAVWGAVRGLAIRLLALPFSRVGSLFVSEDSKLDAVTVNPVVFEPGTDRLAPSMDEHLDRVAAFLRNAPSVLPALVPIVTAADVDALKRETVLARLRAEGGADPLEAARREYRGRWPDRAVPDTLAALAAELATADPQPADALQDLSARRLEVVRQRLTRGGVEASRLSGRARRTALVETTGTGRVELELRPEMLR
jgi:hypothetical protein